MKKHPLLRVLLCLLAAVVNGGGAERPLFREFAGLNGHTVQFKPELYRPVCRVVRDYHPVEWDLGEDTSVLPEWPFAKNRVSWERVYGSWHRAGYRISVCLMIDELNGKWKNPEADAKAYAKSFARRFGPGGEWPFVEWVEIGNEPGLYSDNEYRAVFKAMAEGVREGNPGLKIVTCNVEAGAGDRYWKSANLFKDAPELYDALQIHRYAIAEQWPTWRRTYPENPKTPYLESVRNLLRWRDENAPGKPVWVSEFGWDSSTKKPDPDGEWAKWTGSTDAEQARWLVRSFFLFAEMGVDKAFVYFFNDEDEPKLHASSGLTRHFQPKPAYHAVAWMLRSLENHRFHRAIQSSLEDGYVFEFTPEKAGEPVIRAVWRATGTKEAVLDVKGPRLLKAEKMPLTAGPAESPALKAEEGVVRLTLEETPVLLWLTAE